MVVDDSSVVRGLITRVLETDGIQIVASAANGTAALAMLKRSEPHKITADIIILDVQIPQTGGGENILPEVRKHAPDAKIIMACTLNEPNVMASLDALDMGANELIAKPSSRKNPEETRIFIDEIVRKVKRLGGLPADEIALPIEVLDTIATASASESEKTPTAGITLPGVEAEAFTLRKPPGFFRPQILAVASSTGGPKALQVFFEGLGKRVSHLPIFITQHMPKDFTHSLAQQIGRYSGLSSAEGADGETVMPGKIYLAPGDYHMVVEKKGDGGVIRLNQDAPENFCRPAADPMLRSLYNVYGKDILVVVLTGMGQDGMLGAKLIADNGGMVIAQDKDTSVVWGMPGAVAKEGVCTYVLPLPQLADAVVKVCSGYAL